MGQKYDYLAWREKNGFFSALDKQGDILTWSLLTGKLLYVEEQKQEEAGSKSNLRKYQVYRSDSNDVTYTRNYYNQKDRTIQLIYSPSPMYDKEHKQAFVKEAMAAKFKKQISRFRKTSIQHDVAPLDPELFEASPPTCKIEVHDN